MIIYTTAQTDNDLKGILTLQKANLAFMRIDVPAGHSVVEWKYRPFKVYIGMIISSLCLMAVLLYFVIRRKTKTGHE